MLSGRENYQRAIEFSGPQYLPMRIDCDLSWLMEQNEAKASRIRELQVRIPDDIAVVSEKPKPRAEPSVVNGIRRWVDHWGTGWVDDGHGGKTESYPLEAGYCLMDTHRFPDPHAEGLFDDADHRLQGRRDRYVLGSVWFTLFERLWMLRGFNNMLTDPYLNTDNWRGLLDRVLEYDLIMIDECLSRGVDGVFFSDDWGSQRGLLMDPDDWRRYYKPAYATMFRRVREGGAHVWMHLCGDITAILHDLVDIGLSVLNPVQPQAMDVHGLARDFGGRLCFHGGVDVQGTMIHGSPSDVKREAHALVDLFGSFSGGYIAGTSHSIMPETPLDNVIALYEAFAEYL